jgi:hypothetical protein
MAGTQCLLVSLAGIPRSAKPDALGIVAQADRATLGSQCSFSCQETFGVIGRRRNGAALSYLPAALRSRAR